MLGATAGTVRRGRVLSPSSPAQSHLASVFPVPGTGGLALGTTDWDWKAFGGHLDDVECGFSDLS